MHQEALFSAKAHLHPGELPGNRVCLLRPKRRRWRWRLAATCAAISRTSPRSRRKRPGRMAFWRPDRPMERVSGWQSWHQGGSLNNLPSQDEFGVILMRSCLGIQQGICVDLWVEEGSGGLCWHDSWDLVNITIAVLWLYMIIYESVLRLPFEDIIFWFLEICRGSFTFPASLLSNFY